MTRVEDPDDHLRRTVLAKVLPLAAFEGWTGDVLNTAMEACGVDREQTFHLFPDGVRDLLSFASLDSDRDMCNLLGEIDLDSLKIRERIERAVQIRIDLLEDHRSSVRRAIAFLGLPQNQLLGTRIIGRTVDTIWRAIGDQSTDFNFYTKRATLAAVYSSTVLYWLSDESEGSAETGAFLGRRIENVMQFERGKARARKALAKLPNPWSVAAAIRYPSRY